ncbi:MAG: SpoIIE family protein phosphatase [Candidatus Eremiobacteraeota bacterium]|nr:SpoIIE family protein phosphatase [Candidatus Eremiobacteraeota bacterium]
MQSFIGSKARRGGAFPGSPNVGLGRPAFTAATVLAIALFVSVLGSFFTYVNARSAYARQTILSQGQNDLQVLLRSQLDEETALRGYLASGQRVFLQPYYESGPRFGEDLARLERRMQDSHLSETAPLIFDIRRSHDLWEHDVAKPLLTHPNTIDQVQRLRRGKLLVDQVRLDVTQLSGLLDAQWQLAADAVKRLLLRASTLTAVLMLLFGTSAIVADVIRSRTQAALERERIVGDTLQRAFLSGWDILPYLRIGTAYISAARHAAVGGDLFDVHRIDEDSCLFVVADVSGKGLEAAVETAFIKYTLRALIEDYRDPSVMMQKFNHAFLRSSRDAGSFVSLFVGIFDQRDSRLRYASAGHGPAYLRRGSAVRQLLVTGPIIGLRESDVFPTTEEQLIADDVLILATDGLTEARDTAGIMLDDDGAIRVLREAPSEPQALADHVVATVSRLSGGRIADDLALLVIGLNSDVARPAAPPQPAVSAARV